MTFRYSLFAILALSIALFSCNDSPAPEQPTSDIQSEIPLFTLLPPSQTGVHFINEIPESSAMNSMVYEYFYNGGGVAIGDINNDGLEDLYFTSNLKENKLYLNKGEMKFEDITKNAGIGGSFGWTTGVSMVDINADGWLDIYISKSGKGKAENRANELYINNQNKTFTESAAQYQLDFDGYSTQATFLDYDLDGDLDIFLLNHNVNPINTNTPEEFTKEINTNVGDKLLRNEAGKFIEVSQQAGIHQNALGFGLGVSVGDINNDGYPDIYVANDYIEHDYLYINNGDGTFTDHSANSLKHTSNFSMGTDIADFNNDGWSDIISLDMVAEDNYSIKTSMSGMNPAAFEHAVAHGFQHQYMYNALQMNNGTTTADPPLFSEIAQMSGVSNTDWSWSPLLADFDNDGWKDLFVTNGLKRDFRNNDFRKQKLERIEKARKQGEKMSTVIEELVARTPQRKTTNYFFKNNQDLTFSKTSQEWGMNTASFSNGAAYADLDNDGDLDLVVNNIDEAAHILQNNTTKNYIKLSFEGPRFNPFGIGTKVSITSGGTTQVSENFPVRGYQSSSSPNMIFGLSNHAKIEKVVIGWPDGKRQVIHDAVPNQHITVKYDDASSKSKDVQDLEKGQFLEDATASFNLNHRHIENEFDDFARESLLPHKLSEFGPALTVGDFNGDGLEDFFVGGASGYAAELFFQREDGSFEASKFTIWKEDKEYEDVDATFFDADNDGDLDLYVVSGGNEFEPGSSYLQDRLYLNDGMKNLKKNNRLLPKIRASGACVKSCDYDADGDLDLFIGGRLEIGKYPNAPKSYLLRNEAGVFKDVSEDLAPELSRLGMVTDGLWTDYDSDGDKDLIVVGEWMQISIFKNDDGALFKAEITDTNADELPTGWWFGIEAFDIDADGDDDYLVGNLGLNYKYQASADEPFEIYCNDFDDNGSLDIVLGYYDQGEIFPLRGRECSSNQMPFLKDKFPTYHDFGSANLTQVYGLESLESALHYEATSFASIFLKNLGGGQFQINHLPNHAQISNINDFIVDDWDGDGHKEVVLGGNLYQSEVETPRNDASTGLVLRIVSDHTFQVEPNIKSGFNLEGDVKRMAPITLGDKKGILVAKNNDFLKLFSTK